MAEVLAKVVKQVGDAEAEAERRSRILDAIEDLRSMRAECSWLTEYDRDDSRYKVRSPLCDTLSGLISRYLLLCMHGASSHAQL